jgi:hypothetical protein
VLRPLSLGTLNYLPSGPTGIVFALLAQYHAAIPHTFKYRISTHGSTARRTASEDSSSSSNNNSSSSDNKRSLTILLSDKSTTYLVAAQLALSQFPASLLPAFVGWAVGIAWRADLLASRSTGGWRVPAWVVGEKERQSASGSADRPGEDDERYADLRRRLDAASASAAGASSAVDGGTQRRPLLERLTAF